MAEEKKTDDVEKILTEEKALDDRKQALIADLLKRREVAMAEFDERLAKLGYRASSTGKGRRSHHKKTAQPEEKPKTKG